MYSCTLPIEGPNQFVWSNIKEIVGVRCTSIRIACTTILTEILERNKKEKCVCNVDNAGEGWFTNQWEYFSTEFEGKYFPTYDCNYMVFFLFLFFFFFFLWVKIHTNFFRSIYLLIIDWLLAKTWQYFSYAPSWREIEDIHKISMKMYPISPITVYK